MNNEVDYRLYGIVVPIESRYYHELKLFVEVKKTRRAIADNARYPSIIRVRKYIAFYACLFKNNETVTLYWNGQDIIDKVEYEGKLANLQKHWLKVQAERDRKATVKDVERFLRQNSVNSNGKPDTKAGQNTSEDRESIDRCQGVK